MYSNILLVHRIIVTIFLLHYALKLVLLLLDKKDELAKYSKATRVLEMIVSLAFLVTGGWMLITSGSYGTFMIIKLLCVFASIPLAIIGFKRSNKMLAVLAVVLLVAAYGLAEMNKKAKTGGHIDTSSSNDPIMIGKIVYQGSCMNCHGEDGRLGGSGAKDLSATSLTIEDQRVIIKNGKGAMPGYKDLTNEQVEGVIQYIATFKK